MSTLEPQLPRAAPPSWWRLVGGGGTRRRLGRVGVFVVLAGVALTMVTPMFWMFITSLKTEAELYLIPPTLFPAKPIWDNYAAAFSFIPYWRMMFNSAFVAIVVMVARVVTSTLAGFAFARLQFPGRDKLFVMYIAVLMVPFTVTMIPLYIIVRAFGWIDNLAALIFPMFVSAYNTFLARQFMLSLPVDLDDAARIDGANPWVIYLRIILPLSKPVIAVIALFSFMTSWNSFIWPLLVLSSQDNLTIPIGLAVIAAGKESSGEYVQWNYLMAAATAAAAPIIGLFLVAQRQFVQGIAMTGLRG